MTEILNDAEAELAKVARVLAARSEARLAQTVAEIVDLEEQLQQLKARRDGQRDAQGRLKNYRPKVGLSEYLCPNCWIIDGQSSTLRAIPFERPNEDIMRCGTCGHDFGVSLRD